MTQRLLTFYVAALPFEYLWSWLLGSETELKPYRLIGIALAFVWLLERVGAARRTRFQFDAYDRLFTGLLVLGLALAAFWDVLRGDVDLAMAWHNTLLAGFALITYIVIKNSDTNLQRFERLLSLYVYAVCASVVLAYMVGVPTDGGRFTGFSGQANRLGLSTTIGLHVMIAKILVGKRQTAVVYVGRAALIFILLLALLFTGSRGSMLAFACSLPLHAIVLSRAVGRKGKTARKLAAIAPVLMIGGVVVALMFGRYGEQATGLRRVVDSPKDVTSGRYDIWRAAWDASVDYMFIGMGTSQYRAQSRTYVDQLEALRNPNIKNRELGTHSDIMNMLTSYGLVGILLYTWLFVSLFRRLRAWAHAMADPPGWLQQALLPLLGVMFLGGLTTILINSPNYFFVMAIMTFVVRSIAVARRPATVWSDRISAAEIGRRVPRSAGGVPR